MTKLIEQPICPVCECARLRYVEFVYHYYPIDSVFRGGINLAPEEDVSEFETDHDVTCLDCGTVFKSSTLFEVIQGE